MKKRADASLQINNQETKSNEENNDKKKPEKKYSIMVYVIVMFSVMLLIVTLSYFMQQRDNGETIESLNQEHNEFSLSALDKIEKLQENNVDLTNKI